MKTLLLTLLLLLAITAAWSQAPQRISYQSIIRDANNVVVASTTVGVKISLIQGTATGSVVYSEIHRKTTNANGLLSLEIGDGTAISGTFAGIDWANGPYLIKTETDPTGGTNYSIPGIAALNSVPYALFSANGTPGPIGLTGPVGPAGPTGLTGAAGVGGVTIAGTNITLSGSGTVASPYVVSSNIPAAAAGTLTGGSLNATVTGSSLTSVGTLTNLTVTNPIVGSVTGSSGSTTGNAATVTNGVYTVGDQTLAGAKTFNKDIVVNSVMIGKGGNTLADNIAIGNGARSGNINTGGNANIAIGTDAQKNNTGFYNVSVGNANLVNGSGDENTAIGYGVMSNNTTGIRNTGVGLFTFYQNTTGGYNTAIGHGSLGVNTTGSYNTALGTSADVATNNLTNATAIGYGASVDASNSIQLGNTAVTNVKTSGTITADAVTYPKAHGTAGQVLSTTGTGTLTWATPSGGVPYTGATQAVDLGAYDLKVNGLTIGRGGGNVDGNTANGSMSLYSNSSGNSNTAYGYASLYSNTTGSNNIANGNQSLYFNTTGSNNTAIGNASLNFNTTGSYNTAVGPSALYSNTIGSNNTATGYIALYKNTTGTDNTASGMFALYANTAGAYNTATGYGALSANTEGVYNTATGYVALASNTTGLANLASGNYALTGNTTGNSNTASGYSALRANTTGSSNTASGYNALDANTTGTNNTAIGYYANVGSDNLTNATAIGAGAIVNASDNIQLGNTSVTNVKTSGTITAGAVTYPNTHGTNGQVLSSTGNGTLSWITPSATATTYSGVLPISNGGTGQTTLPGIKSMLGLLSNNVAIGNEAGTPSQGENANTIAIGGGAGRENQGQGSVAIGYVSGDQNQGSASVAIGGNAAQSGQGTQAVALGFAAGQNGQGDYSVAVGSFAGNVQAANSIALNATGASLNPLTTGFFVDPIINRAATSTALYYNTTTKEITSGTPAVAGTWSITTISNTPSGLTFSSGSGFYSRVGNIVSFSASVKFSVTGSTIIGQNFFEIDLPIPSDFTNTNDANGTVSGTSGNFGGTSAGFIESNDTLNKLKIRYEGSSSSPIIPSDLQIGISGMYIVK